jgi:hypothetical protein
MKKIILVFTIMILCMGIAHAQILKAPIQGQTDTIEKADYLEVSDEIVQKSFGDVDKDNMNAMCKQMVDAAALRMDALEEYAERLEEVLEEKDIEKGTTTQKLSVKNIKPVKELIGTMKPVETASELKIPGAKVFNYFAKLFNLGKERIGPKNLVTDLVPDVIEEETTTEKKETSSFDKDKMMSDKYALFKLTVVQGDDLTITSKVNKEEFVSLVAETPGEYLYITDVRVGGIDGGSFNWWLNMHDDPSYISFKPQNKAEDWVIVKARVLEHGSKFAASGTIIEMLGGSKSVYGIRQTYDTYEFFVRLDDGKTYTVRSSTKVSNKDWQTVLGVYDGYKIELYVGGKLEATKATSALATLPGKSQQAHYSIGNSGKNGDQFEGELDNLYVWGN